MRSALPESLAIREMTYRSDPHIEFYDSLLLIVGVTCAVMTVLMIANRLEPRYVGVLGRAVSLLVIAGQDKGSTSDEIGDIASCSLARFRRAASESP